MKDFLFVTSRPVLQENIKASCASNEYSCLIESVFENVLSLIDTEKLKYIFIDLDDDKMRGLQLLEWIQTRTLNTRIGIISEKSYKPSYLQALRLGATEHLAFQQAADSDALSRILGSFIAEYDLQINLAYYQSPFKHKPPLAWVGTDPSIRFLLERVRSLAHTTQPVLITGNSGAGKRHLAMILAGENPSRKLIEIDASVIPDYEQKSFFNEQLNKCLFPADQNAPQDVKCELCIIVSEITRLHPELQEVFAEYIKDAVLTLEGKELSIIMQVVATSSCNIEQAARDGFLREDLYLLLKNSELQVPSLCDRPYDLPLLVDYYLKQQLTEDKHCYFSRDAMTALVNYEWPQEVDELFEVLSGVLDRAQSGMITSRMLPHKILQKSFYTTHAEEESLTALDYNEAKKRVLNKFNRTYIEGMLNKSDGNLTVAAERAGMDRSNFKKIIKKYGVK